MDAKYCKYCGGQLAEDGSCTCEESRREISGAPVDTFYTPYRSEDTKSSIESDNTLSSYDDTYQSLNGSSNYTSNLFEQDPKGHGSKQNTYAEFGSNSGAGTAAAGQPSSKGRNIIAGLVTLVLLVSIIGGLYFYFTGNSSSNGSMSGELEYVLACIEERDNDELAKYLGKNAVDLDYYDDEIYSPIFWAIYSDNIDAIPILVENGADLNQGDEIEGWMSPLEFALYNQNLKAMQVLIDLGVDIELTDQYGATVLMYSSGYGAEYLELMLDANADVSKKDDSGWNALHYATWYGEVNCYSQLVAAGGDESALTNKGYNMAQTALTGESLEMLSTLMEKGFEISDIPGGDTLLHMVGSDLMAEFVMSYYECDYTAVNADGDTPLHRAMNSWMSVNVVKKYLANGADPNAQNNSGATPLMLAVWDENIVEMMLEHGADKSIQDEDGDTAYDYIQYFDNYYGEGSVSDKTKQLLTDSQAA